MVKLRTLTPVSYVQVVVSLPKRKTVAAALIVFIDVAATGTSLEWLGVRQESREVKSSTNFLTLKLS